MKTKLQGLESMFLVDWKDWDGDHSYMDFYDCELLPEIAELIGVTKEVVVDLSINTEEFFRGASITFWDGEAAGRGEPKLIARATPVLDDGLVLRFEFEVM